MMVINPKQPNDPPWPIIYLGQPGDGMIFCIRVFMYEF